jgi:hypothetical protein
MDWRILVFYPEPEAWLHLACDHMVVEFTTTYEISQWLTLQVQIPLRRGVLDTTLYDTVCQ